MRRQVSSGLDSLPGFLPRLFSRRKKRQFPAKIFLFGEGIDSFGDGEIPGGDAVGLEEGDLFVVGAAWDFGGDELVEFVDGVPFLGSLLKWNDEVAGLLFGLLNGIHEDEGSAGDGG